MAEYKSKHGIVSRPSYELYMSFADMRNFLRFLPEDKREGVTADYDTLKASVQGFPIGVKITERTPYSRIILWDDGAPFHFTAEFHFDAANDAYKTEFYIILNAELIQTIESTPDTVITLVNEKKFIVEEPADEVVRRVMKYRRALRQS